MKIKTNLIIACLSSSLILSGCGAQNDPQTQAIQEQTAQVINQYRLTGNQSNDYHALYQTILTQGQQAATRLKKGKSTNRYQDAVRISTLLIIGNQNNNQLAASNPLPDQKQLLYQQLTNPKKYGTDLVTVDTSGLSGDHKIATEIMNNYSSIDNSTIQQLNQYIGNNFYAFMLNHAN